MRGEGKTLQNRKPDPFIERILANQSESRRAANESLGRVFSEHLPTAYDKELNEQIDWMLDSILRELGYQSGVEASRAQMRGGRMLLVTGRAGAGKSCSLMHAFQTRDEFAGFGEEGSNSPVLSVVAPSPFTLAALGNVIIKKLGFHGDKEVKHTRVWSVVRDLMAECGVRILHIDEAQHGDEIQSAVMTQEVGNTLKRMMQEVDWPIWLILSGLPELTRFCQKDPSMRRRVRVLHFDGLSQERNSDHVLSAVRKLVGLCPSITCDELVATDFAHRLLHASTYQFGIVVEFIQDAIAECLAVEGGGELKLGHFADVYSIRTGVLDDDLNPFISGFWDSISVETALFEPVIDEDGNATGTLARKKRKTKGSK